MTQSIPASQIVSVTPGVITAGGTGLTLSGLLLSSSTRVPIGQVLSFANAAAVLAYFGSAAVEYAYAAVYFAGFDNSNIKPAALLIAQYNPAPVAPYLRGGSGVTLAQAQSIVSGTISVTVNGVVKTSSALNLSASTSLSNAASLVTTALGASDVAVTGSIAVGAAVVTGAIAGTVLTVTAVTSGVVVPGIILSGTGVTASTAVVTQLTGTPGGIGTYTVSISQTAASTSITGAAGGGLLTVTAAATPGLTVGMVITGGTTAAGTTITSIVTGTGGIGTYGVSISQTVVSGAITGGALVVSYDSIAGSFVVTGGTPGATGTIGYVSGTPAATLKLTAATGAVLSQGAAPATPAAYMTAITGQTQNWATFTTTFEPVTADCLSFALWTSQQNNRWTYVCWDTDVTPTLGNDTSSIGYQIKQAAYSGTIPVWMATDTYKAPFIMGAIASIDFTQTNGRATLAFKGQAGLTTDVSDITTATNLIASGYNFYGAYATAAQNFNFFYPGSISGPFLWVDSYIDQIYLNNSLQLALMSLLTSVRSIPYNNAGYSLIRQAVQDPINAALNAGVIRTGVTLSAAQAAAVNNAAGLAIDGTLTSRGWYFQVLAASPIVRAARQSPPCTLWYTDGQSIQQINLASLDIQ